MNVLDFLPVDAWSALLLVTALKGAIILVSALLATRLLARTSAATRHAVWVLAFVAVLALPVLLVAVPGWQVPVLPEGGILPGLNEEVSLGLPGIGATQGSSSFVESSLVAPKPATRTLSLGVVLLLFWGIGAFFVAARWTAGVLSARVLTRRAIELDDPDWKASLNRVSAALGLKRTVALRMSAHTLTPMTWGTLRPVVLLPESAIRWTADRRTVVLTHELAHVRRFDGLSQLVAQAACVLHWFNPFVWKSYQRFLVEREHACDDYVLEEGTRASVYAEHLLDIAKGLRNQQRAELAMAPMAHRTQIEERLRSILNDRQRRDKLSNGLLVVVSTLVLALVWPVVAITLVPRDFEAIAQDAPAPPLARVSPDAPAPPLPPQAPQLPPATLPPLPPAPPLPPDPPAPPAPSRSLGLFMEPVSNVLSGPAAVANERTAVRFQVTDEQRRRKLMRDSRFDSRLEATLAAEMEEAGRRVQVSVAQIVEDVENERWDVLDIRTRSIVRHVEAVVREAREVGATEWIDEQAAQLAAIDQDSDVIAAIEWKRSVQESSRGARPSANPRRTNTNQNSSTCQENGSNE